jgi:hypothetical protein
MKILEILAEKKVEMCPKACCGQPVTECKCGPDCKHCDCYEKNKTMKETTMASSIATSVGGGNGFASGGIGTEPIKRVSNNNSKSKKKKKTKA